MCHGDHDDDLETVLNIPATNPAVISPAPGHTLPCHQSQAATEEEKLDMESTTAKILDEFEEFLACPTQETEFDKILANNEAKWTEFDLMFPDLD